MELERSNSIQIETPMSPLDIKQYNAKTLPKRIEKIKQKRAKKETFTFYTDLADDVDDADDTILKIVESTDGHDQHVNDAIKPQEIEKTMNFTKKKDSEIIRSILEKSEFKKITRQGALRRKSLEQTERSPLTSRKLSEALTAIQHESTQKESKATENLPICEPLYEQLLRNVHVPYKFAPPIVKRSLSVSSTSSVKEAADLSPKLAASSTTLNDDENDGSECDYVTLTYSNEGLETIDGEYVGKKNSIQLNEMISNSDTNICYNKRSSISQLNSSGASSDDVKVENSMNDSIIDLERRDSISSRSRSFLHKFITMKSHDDDLTSQRSVAASISSRKSLDGGMSFIPKNHPPVYRQGSQDLGNRIAHVDYADPKTLFPSAVNIFVNKNSLNQRDSVVSSSSDSVCDKQKLNQHEPEMFSDSFYEDTAESLLENDFRDSAIYSDDSNGRKVELNTLSDEHIYATISKQDPKPTPPKIPKKPNIPVRITAAIRFPSALTHVSPPPVPAKPSNLKTPEIRNAIFSVRKLNQPSEHVANKSLSPTSAKNWVTQQVQKFQ